MAAISLEHLTTNKAAFWTLASVGSVWTAYQLLKVLDFGHLHFVRASSLDRYKCKGEEASWALVTGASDGIGKGFAEELCQRSLNVILHGRNEEKLDRVRKELLQQWPTRQIRILVVDAVEHAGDLPRLIEAISELKDLNLRILVNNVGGAASVKPLVSPFQNSPEIATQIQLDLNIRFQTELTRLLLPSLFANQPSAILNVGSASADLPCCYLSVASGVKAYQKAWSRSLTLEMQAEGQDVEVLYFSLGMVSSGSSPRATNLLVPSSRLVARKCLEKVGSGRDVVFGYWPHELQFGLIDLLPRFIADRVISGIAKGEMKAEQAAMKAQRV